jgi:hypothetical protein
MSKVPPVDGPVEELLELVDDDVTPVLAVILSWGPEGLLK